MVIELWLNLEVLERYHLEKEERENLIRELINTIERRTTIEDKAGNLKYLKIYN